MSHFTIRLFRNGIPIPIAIIIEEPPVHFGVASQKLHITDSLPSFKKICFMIFSATRKQNAIYRILGTNLTCLPAFLCPIMVSILQPFNPQYFIQQRYSSLISQLFNRVPLKYVVCYDLFANYTFIYQFSFNKLIIHQFQR